MKRVLLLLVLVLLTTSSNLYAQSQVVWNQSGVNSATQAQSLTYKLYITPSGSTNTTTVTLTSVLCGGTATNPQCSTVLPATASVAATTGTKSELTTTDPTSGVESAKSAPFIKPADAPTNLRITP